MARRPSLIKKKAKIQKKTRSEQYIINKKYLGDEPIFTNKQVDDLKHTHNLFWYNSMCTLSEAKEYLYEYLINVGRDAEAEKFLSVPEKWVVTTAAWIARMRGRGAILKESTLDFFEDSLEKMLSRDYSKTRMEVESNEGEQPEEEEKPKPKPKVTSQDKTKAKIDQLICELEEKIDEFMLDGYKSKFSMYEFLKANEVQPAHVTKIIEKYDPQLCEIEDAYNGVKEAAEGYAGYSKKNLEKLYDFFVLLVEDAQRYSQNEKKTRKPRTPKPISADKKLKDFKYMEKFDPLKLRSIQPTHVLGASELWTFSTKYNQLTVFRMKDKLGLDVHRTAIINFDEANSFTKKLKAKDVQTVLNNVLNGGKVALRNLIKECGGSDQKLQERMNENTILLRAVGK